MLLDARGFHRHGKGRGNVTQSWRFALGCRRKSLNVPRVKPAFNLSFVSITPRFSPPNL